MSFIEKNRNTSSPGTLRITINNCFLNEPVKRPYVTVTLGDQFHKTSVSEYQQGSWNEGFELKVTFHNQLFDTIQLDLYDNNMFFADKHVGRSEIRLKDLEGMPHVFTSYYEILEKKILVGSQVSRKQLMTSGVGAIQAEIAYEYCYKEQRNSSFDFSEMNWLIDQHQKALSNSMSDQELIEEFNRHLKNHQSSDDIQFKKYEQLEEEESPDSSDNEEQRTVVVEDPKPLNFAKLRVNSTIKTTIEEPPKDTTAAANKSGGILRSMSTLFGFTNTEPIIETTTIEAGAHINTDDDTLKSFPILDAIGSRMMAKETNQVLRTIGKLLVAFGQGFELSNLQILSGFNVVERFYSDLPRERTWDLVEDVHEIETASYMWRYAMASYGWKGLNFIGKGNGIFSDAVRAQSDALSICEHLQLNKEDLLAYELRTDAAFRPSYFVARDRKLNAIVLSIRGTMSTFDTMTDLVCEYEPWKGGLVHKGMKSSAMWFFRHIAPKLIAYVNKHSTTSLYIVGHSLGASTAAILTIMLQDYINEFRKEGDFNIYSIGYAPACGISLDLANKYKDQIQSFVFADDFVSKLSYGSMMDVKELIITGAEAAKEIGLAQLIWGGELDKETWKEAFQRVSECRKRCLELMSNPRLYVAGTVYQFWLDPTPNNESRIVIERTTPERVSTELIIRMSILLDHLPTNFDVAFSRAIDALDASPKIRKNKLFEKVAEVGLKGTTKRDGGEGNIIQQ